MRNHTLMQTIARANRVFPGKHSGLVVDYANVFASLEKALAIYGAGRGGASPVRDKAELVAALGDAVALATRFCAAHGVDLDALEATTPGSLRSEEHTSELQSLMRISYAVFGLKKKKQTTHIQSWNHTYDHTNIPRT